MMVTIQTSIWRRVGHPEGEGGAQPRGIRIEEENLRPHARSSGQALIGLCAWRGGGRRSTETTKATNFCRVSTSMVWSEPSHEP